MRYEKLPEPKGFDWDNWRFECWKCSIYRGIPIKQNPVDLWLMHELIQLSRPRTIIETGTANGGSAVFFYDQLKMLHGSSENISVISIDVAPNIYPTVIDLAYVVLLRGDSVSDFCKVMESDIYPPVMVTLDSDHSEAHVYKEIELYWPLVSPGQLLLVQDGGAVRGPSAAVSRWLKRPGFPFDVLEPDRFGGLSVHGNGWLLRR